MKTKRCIISILICILLLVGFVLTASLLTPKVARAEDEISGDILQPFKDNYNYIGTPTSVCADDNNIYIASGDIIYVYGLDSLQFLNKITVEFDIKKIRIWGNHIYLQTSDGKLVEMIGKDTQNIKEITDAVNIIDFDIVDNNFVYAENNGTNITAYYKNFSTNTTNTYTLNPATADNLRITCMEDNIYYHSKNKDTTILYMCDYSESIAIESDKNIKCLTSYGDNLFISSSNYIKSHNGNSSSGFNTIGDISNTVKDMYVTKKGVFLIDEKYNAVLIYNYNDADIIFKGEISYSFNTKDSLFAPIDIIERNGRIFILDENNIKIIDENGKSNILCDLSVKFNKRGIAVDDSGNVYLLLANTIEVYDGESGMLVKILNSPENLIDIAYAVDGNLYALASNNKNIYKVILEKSDNEFTIFKTGTSASKIATNLKTKKLYALSGSEIFVYSLDSNDTHSISTGIAGTIIDIQTDFNDNIYVLSKTDGNFFLTKLDKSSNFEKAFEPKKIDCSDLPNPDGLCSITINNNNGEVLIADSSQHYILAFSKSNTGTIVSTDIPFIEPETKILSNSFQRENTIVKIGTITGFPSTLFYPIHTDVSSSIFPKNNDNTNKSVTILENGTQVLIVEEIEHDDDTFYYVIANGMAGFVYGDAVSVDRISNFEPIALEPVNQSVVLLSYPSTKTINLKNSYAVVDKNGNQLRAHIDDFELNEDDKQIMFAFSQFTFIENNVATSWYFVSYKGNFCFVDASSVVKSSNLTYSNPFKYARISTGINAGLANVYNDITPTEDSVLAGSLKDNERVKVTWEGENISYIRYQDGQGNTITEGYINNKYILYNGLTTTQLAILILAFSTVLLAVATVVAIKVFKK